MSQLNDDLLITLKRYRGEIEALNEKISALEDLLLRAYGWIGVKPANNRAAKEYREVLKEVSELRNAKIASEE